MWNWLPSYTTFCHGVMLAMLGFTAWCVLVDELCLQQPEPRGEVMEWDDRPCDSDERHVESHHEWERESWKYGEDDRLCESDERGEESHHEWERESWKHDEDDRLCEFCSGRCEYWLPGPEARTP